MKLRAKDTLHVSSVKADNILPGEQFDVPDDIGRQLIARGLAAALAAPKRVRAKADAPPANKMAAAPKNKSAGPVKGK